MPWSPAPEARITTPSTKPDVREAGDEERLERGPAGGLLAAPVADEQVGAPAHHLPADEGQDEVGGLDDEEHGGEEQRDGGGEDAVAVVVAQVPAGERLHRPADDGDDGGDEGGQRAVCEQQGNLERPPRGPGACAPSGRCSSRRRRHQAGQGGRERGEREADGDQRAPPRCHGGQGTAPRPRRGQAGARRGAPRQGSSARFRGQWGRLGRLGLVGRRAGCCAAEVDVAAEPEDGQHHGERDADLGGGDGDDEQGQDVPGLQGRRRRPGGHRARTLAALRISSTPMRTSTALRRARRRRCPRPASTAARQ